MKEGWEYKTLGECCRISDFVSNGSFASLKQNVNYYYAKNYALLVRLADNSNNFDESKFVYTDKHGYDFTSKSHLHGGEIIGSVVAWLQRDGFHFIPRAASSILTCIITFVIHRPVCSGLDSGTNDLNGIMEFDIVRTGGNIQREGIRVVRLLLCFGQQGVDGLHLVLALPIIRSFETFIIASTCEVGRATTAGRSQNSMRWPPS